jgi:hypothetical protein
MENTNILKQRLLSDLLEKMEGKPVSKTLSRIDEKLSWTSIKAISSLLTHAIIECEQGNSEYHVLVVHLQEKLGQMIYDIGDRE